MSYHYKSVAGLPGIFCDAAVGQPNGQLAFASLWGRDTAVQHMLAALSLPVEQGGIDELSILDPNHGEKFFIGAEIGRQQTRVIVPNIGSLIHVWLYTQSLVRNTAGTNSATLLVRANDPNDSIDTVLWSMINESTRLPLLADWEDGVVEHVRKNHDLNITVGLNVNCIKLTLERESFERFISDGVREGVLVAGGQHEA